jgi:hypothetical protein
MPSAFGPARIPDVSLNVAENEPCRWSGAAGRPHDYHRNITGCSPRPARRSPRAGYPAPRRRTVARRSIGYAPESSASFRFYVAENLMISPGSATRAAAGVDDPGAKGLSVFPRSAVQRGL